MENSLAERKANVNKRMDRLAEVNKEYFFVLQDDLLTAAEKRLDVFESILNIDSES